MTAAELEAFARKSAQMDDAAVATLFTSRGGRSVDLTAASLHKWQEIARSTAWRDYGEKNANCARLLALAEKTAHVVDTFVGAMRQLPERRQVALFFLYTAAYWLTNGAGMALLGRVFDGTGPGEGFQRKVATPLL